VQQECKREGAATRFQPVSTAGKKRGRPRAFKDIPDTPKDHLIKEFMEDISMFDASLMICMKTMCVTVGHSFWHVGLR